MAPSSLNTTLVQPKLAIHDYSRRIFKLEPKIRIIHIVEPEIIKTDVENFQELVQRLTGKPAVKIGSISEVKNDSKPILQPKPYASKPILEGTHRMKKEIEETYHKEYQNALSSCLGDVDGFLHDMNEFPLLYISDASMLVENFPTFSYH